MIKTMSAGGLLLAAGTAGLGQQKKRRVLYFTKSATFEHGPIKEPDGKPGWSQKILTDEGAKRGIEVICTKDGSIFTPESIAGFDAFVFYTTGDLTEVGKDGHPAMPKAGKDAFLEAIRQGKGFVGIHSATDTFHSKGDRYVNRDVAERDPYIQMLGGEFIKHGKQQETMMRLSQPGFPGTEGLGEGFKLLDEWYTFYNLADDLAVILVNETEGMEGEDYQRPAFPGTWARMHGEGRVFQTSMGHREDVWTNPIFQQVLFGGLAWTLRDVDFDLRPNLLEACPGAHTLQPKPKPKPQG